MTTDQEKKGRGFAGMDAQKQREIASKGGRAAHQKGTAHEFDAGEARTAGRKGGLSVSQDRAHMAQIGRNGGQARGARAQAARLRAKSQPSAAMSGQLAQQDRNMMASEQHRGTVNMSQINREHEMSKQMNQQNKNQQNMPNKNQQQQGMQNKNQQNMNPQNMMGKNMPNMPQQKHGQNQGHMSHNH